MWFGLQRFVYLLIAFDVVTTADEAVGTVTR